MGAVQISQRKFFLTEAFDLIGSTTILGVSYGIPFTLYCLCARSWYLQFHKPDKRRQARFTLSYISVLFFCATGVLAMNARLAQLAYVNHADFPGGPLGYGESFNPTTDASETTCTTLDFTVEVLTMAIQVWRLWIVWSATGYATVMVIILPLSRLLLLGYIALAIPMDIIGGFMPLDIPHRSLVAMGTAGYAVPSASTVLVTGLIAVRLLLVRRYHLKEMELSDAASPYVSIIAMLVESYVLDSAWSLATAISFASGNPSFYLFATNDSTIKIIAYFLVMYRVANGRGWTKQTEEKLSSLHWNHDRCKTTDGAAPSAAVGSTVDSSPISRTHHNYSAA